MQMKARFFIKTEDFKIIIPHTSLGLALSSEGPGVVRVYFVSSKWVSLQVHPRSQFRFSWAIRKLF